MVDERALLEYRQVTPRATPASQMMPAAEVEALYQETAMERFCLGTLLSYPEALYRIDRELQALEQDRLSVKDFNGSDLRVIFQAVRSALNQDEEEPVDYWRNSLDETLLTTAEKLLGEAAEMDLNQPKVLGEVLANFLRLRKRNLESQLSQLRFRIEAVQGMEIDQDQELQSQLWDHTREVQQLASKKERLDRALAQPSGLRSGVPPGEW
jgi:replicative DNA helicase